MKKLILLSLITLSCICKAQPSNITEYYYFDKATNKVQHMTRALIPLTAQGMSTVYTDGKHLIDTIGKRFDSLVDKIAPKLGIAADKVWVTLVRQQKVWAYMWTFILMVNLFLWYKCVKFIKETDGEDNTLALAIISGIFAATGSIFIMCNWTLIWTGWFNPEYGAMLQLAEFAQSLK